MTLETVILQHFRNYDAQRFEFSSEVTMIVAPNAAGKTNILEAIFLLATGKSFRADRDIEMIQWKNEFGRVKATIGDTTLEVLITQSKKYLLNGIARRQIDFVGNLRAVLFWPEHLALVTDSPSVRRRYLDSVLVQVDREYRRNLLSYERGLRQRNRLLDLINEGKASRNQLIFWNQLLIKSAAYITDSRTAFIDFINTYQLTKSQNNKLTYDKSIISQSRLEQYKDEEVAAKATLVGPHRDDITFLLDDRSLASFGSRGQQRMAILWLKLAELSFIQTKSGERPILLLDDIFSELDETHKKLVMDVIGRQQTIITSANPMRVNAVVIEL